MHVNYFEHRHLLSPSLISSHFYWAPSSQEVPLCVSISVSLYLDPLNRWLKVACVSTGRELLTGAWVATQWLQLLIKWPALPQQPLTTKPSSIHDGIATDLIFYIHVKIMRTCAISRMSWPSCFQMSIYSIPPRPSAHILSAPSSAMSPGPCLGGEDNRHVPYRTEHSTAHSIHISLTN